MKIPAPRIQVHETLAIAAMGAQGVAPAVRARVLGLVRKYVAAHGFLPDEGGRFGDLIAGAANALSPRREAAEDALEAKDAWGDAFDYYTPRVDAALYVGLTLGLLLALNGGREGAGCTQQLQRDGHLTRAEAAAYLRFRNVKSFDRWVRTLGVRAAAKRGRTPLFTAQQLDRAMEVSSRP